MSLSVLELLQAELEAGRTAVLVALVAFQGSVPRKDHPLALFTGDGRQHGTVGGGCLDGLARELARKTMEHGGTRRAARDLAGEEAEDSGLLCGGQVELEAERFDPGEEALARVGRRLADPALRPPRLLVFGGGHVGLATARFAHAVGFVVSVLDDREAYANPERFPFAERCLAGPVERADEVPALTAADAILVATRGHAHDLEAMDWASRTGAGYIGLLGSARKRGKILDALHARDAPVENLERRLHSPVGLAIGALTAEEIALASVAQLVAFRRGAL